MNRALIAIASMGILAPTAWVVPANAQADINPNIYPPYRGAPVAQQPAFETISSPLVGHVHEAPVYAVALREPRLVRRERASDGRREGAALHRERGADVPQKLREPRFATRRQVREHAR